MAPRAIVAILLAAATGCIPSGVPRSGGYATDPIFPTGAPMDPSGAIRVVSAPTIREVSAAGLGPVRPGTRLPNGPTPPSAAGTTLLDPSELARFAHLPLPGALPSDAPLPAVATPRDLRQLIGRRDKRDAVAAMLGFASDLGAPQGYGATGPELVAWADAAGRLSDPTTPAQPGDLVVFDRALGDTTSDLVAVVVARDMRGVTELVYLGNGVYRRGFMDPSRKKTRRDDDKRVVNTYLRHGKRWPPKGTRYLAGELVAHVIRMQ